MVCREPCATGTIVFRAYAAGWAFMGLNCDIPAQTPSAWTAPAACFSLAWGSSGKPTRRPAALARRMALSDVPHLIGRQPADLLPAQQEEQTGRFLQFLDGSYSGVQRGAGHHR